MAILKAPKAGAEPAKPGRRACAATARFLTTGDAREWLTIGVTARACSSLSILAAAAGAAAVLPVLGPAGTAGGPRPAAERLDPRQRGRGAAARAVLAQDPDVARWSTYVGRGAIRFYLPLDVQLANPSSPRRWSSPRTSPRANACSRGWSSCWPRSSPTPSARVSPLELGPPVGWPRAVPRQRARTSSEVREIALRVAGVMADRARRTAGQFRLDGAGARSCASGSTRTRRGCWA